MLQWQFGWTFSAIELFGALVTRRNSAFELVCTVYDNVNCYRMKKIGGRTILPWRDVQMCGDEGGVPVYVMLPMERVSVEKRRKGRRVPP
jgi:hypothetical protein